MHGIKSPRFVAPHISDGQTIEIRCESMRRVPAILLTVGLALGVLCIIWPALIAALGIYTALILVPAAEFFLNRPRILIDGERRIIERKRRDWRHWRQYADIVLSFDQIRQFVIQALMQGPPGDNCAWELVVSETNGARHSLVWHFHKKPITDAAKEAALLTGKPCVQNDDAANAPEWQRWGPVW